MNLKKLTTISLAILTITFMGILMCVGLLFGDDSEGSENVEITSGTCSIYGCLCNDGTISYAKHRQGACSWHGGIYK